MEKIMLYIIALFFIIGIIDYIFGNKLKLGNGIENGIKSMGSLALSMIGILSITPTISDLLSNYIFFWGFNSIYTWVYNKFYDSLSIRNNR